MGNYKKNPKEPYQIKCPNCIRKKIKMAEQSVPNLNQKMANLTMLAREFMRKFALYRSK